MQVFLHLPLDQGLVAGVIGWFKQPGQQVVKGEPLAQVAVAGRLLSLESPANGKLKEVFIGPGEQAITPAAFGVLELSALGTPTEMIPWTPMRHLMARHLTFSNQSAAIVTVHKEVDVSNLLALKEEYEEPIRKRWGVDLGLNPFFIRATAKAVEEMPRFNSKVSPEGLLLAQQIDLGFITEVPGGLRCPKISQANKKGLGQIAQEVQALVHRARFGQLWPQEDGGSFNITSAGAEGPLFSTPILPAPSTAFLAFDAIHERPLAVGGRVAVRPALFLSLSFDHRVFDGREASAFINLVADLLQENPFTGAT